MGPTVTNLALRTRHVRECELPFAEAMFLCFDLCFCGCSPIDQGWQICRLRAGEYWCQSLNHSVRPVGHRHLTGCVIFRGAGCTHRAGMIWDDPWIAVATAATEGRWNTLLPPPPPELSEGTMFCCVRFADLSGSKVQEWIDLVGILWSRAVLQERLTDAWIPLLYRDGELVGTCVLRPRADSLRPRADSLRSRADSLWLLETLRARGAGTLLMRCLMTWIYRYNGPFVLGFTWELTAAQLSVAWWRGWLAAAAAIQYGWVWRPSECSFCPEVHTTPHKPVFSMPMLFRDASGYAVITDSGIGDGWGHVVTVSGTPNWRSICEKGGWRALWCRALTGPKGWRWTGEFIVFGLLNSAQPVPLELFTSSMEI